MPLAKLSSKSQIVLPVAIRKRLKIQPGDELEITTKKNAIIIRKTAVSATEALDACGSDIWRRYEEELDQARDQWN
jgi:AbrB family looped-hinge helix DNA binding protein